MPTPTIVEAEVAARLRLSVTRLARRLRQEAGTGRSPGQLSALAAVHSHGPLTLGALAEHERVTPPSMTSIVAKLEADGLVRRSPDAGDRRVVLASVTPAGRQLVEDSRRRKTTWLTGRVAALTADEQTRLADALDVLDSLATLGDAE